jgi:hypothetical protein
MTSPDTLPLSSQRRLIALSGVAFAVLLLFGWFLSGGNTPDYTAPDAEWVAWAEDNSQLSGIAGFLILLAGVALLHFAGTIRSALGTAEMSLQGSVELARVAFAGAIVGGSCLAMAIVMVVGVLVTPSSADTGNSTDDPLAVDLLSRAVDAPAMVSYTGTQFVAAWSPVDGSKSTSVLVDVEHIAGRSTVVRAHGAVPMAHLEQPSTAAWLDRIPEPADGGSPRKLGYGWTSAPGADARVLSSVCSWPSEVRGASI